MRPILTLIFTVLTSLSMSYGAFASEGIYRLNKNTLHVKIPNTDGWRCSVHRGQLLVKSGPFWKLYPAAEDSAPRKDGSECEPGTNLIIEDKSSALQKIAVANTAQ